MRSRSLTDPVKHFLVELLLVIPDRKSSICKSQDVGPRRRTALAAVAPEPAAMDAVIPAPAGSKPD